MVVHVILRYVVVAVVVLTKVGPKYCVIVHRLNWAQLWAPREADKLSSRLLNRLHIQKYKKINSKQLKKQLEIITSW